MSLFYWLTGGRPMRIDYCLFIDRVSGREVFACIDGFGRKWMAEGAWSWFRVSRVGAERRED
jgi:hypothetical protein